MKFGSDQMNNKKIKLICLIIFLMSLIFSFSSQPAKKSESLSDNVTLVVIDITAKLTNQDISRNKQEKLIKQLRFYIRKTAHFSLYFVLGVLIFNLLKKYSINKQVLFSLIICFLYACSDEVHQYFVMNRTAKLFDVLVDTLGSLIGILICLAFKKIKKSRKDKKY